MTGTDTDVIVIGAGLSELTAARRLTASGLDVIILEAHQHVGGRLLSLHARDGGALDLGATWFWDTDQPVQRLISRARHPDPPAVHGRVGPLPNRSGGPANA